MSTTNLFLDFRKKKTKKKHLWVRIIRRISSSIKQASQWVIYILYILYIRTRVFSVVSQAVCFVEFSHATVRPWLTGYQGSAYNNKTTKYIRHVLTCGVYKKEFRRWQYTINDIYHIPVADYLV